MVENKLILILVVFFNLPKIFLLCKNSSLPEFKNTLVNRWLRGRELRVSYHFGGWALSAVSVQAINIFLFSFLVLLFLIQKSIQFIQNGDGLCSVLNFYSFF